MGKARRKFDTRTTGGTARTVAGLMAGMGLAARRKKSARAAPGRAGAVGKPRTWSIGSSPHRA
jgi:hypothetical protein